MNFRRWLAKSIALEYLKEVNMPFGAHKGKDTADLSIPISYLQWAVANLTNMNTDLRQAMKDEINSRQRGGKPVQVVKTPVPAQNRKVWTKAKVIISAYGLSPGQEVALTQNGSNWDFIVLDKTKKIGTIPSDKVVAVVQSVKDELGQYVKTYNPEEWIKEEEPKVDPVKQEEPAQEGENKYILGPDKIPPGSEGYNIDQKFKQIVESGAKSHIMIEALAGSGKTTMLQHLAWKYGKPGEKWLYLVFNTKNRVEGKEKFPTQWVDVQTTNSFLGHLLKNKENISRLQQTELMAKLSGKRKGEDDEGGGGIREKAREIVDGSQFQQLVKKAGLVSRENSAEVAKQQADNDYEEKALVSLLNSMSYTFQEATLTLLGLVKSYAHDPRKGELEAGIDDILSKYDIDTDMSELKERIQKYAPSFGTAIKYHLKEILGYNFLQKDFKDPIKEATIWLAHETMPGATKQVLNKGGMEYELGQFRDFNDDLWYAAIHADELHWPKYNVVLADEVQDFNQAQMIVIKKLSEAGAKIVAVGDRKQSIYKFRGADSKAFDNLGNMLSELSENKDVKQTLTKNYRSRKAIIDWNNKNTNVKGLVQGKTFKDGWEGAVTEGEVSYQDAFQTLAQEKQAGGVKETAFISRTNEPLVHAALSLLGRGVPFIILGRDVATDLIRAINRTIKSARLTDGYPARTLADKLEEHLESEQKKFGNFSTKKNYLKELNDTTLALTSAISQFDPSSDPENPNPNRFNKPGQRLDTVRSADGHQPKKSIAEFKVWLKAKLTGLEPQDNEQDLAAYKEKLKEKPVVLTTSHKAKGLEWDRVYLLRRDQFPHARAKRPEDIEQEENAFSMSTLRPRDELHIIKLKGQPGYKDKG